jgi:hypothetical protein
MATGADSPKTPLRHTSLELGMKKNTINDYMQKENCNVINCSYCNTSQKIPIGD